MFYKNFTLRLTYDSWANNANGWFLNCHNILTINSRVLFGIRADYKLKPMKNQVLLKERPAGHLRGLRQVETFQNSRGDVGQNAALERLGGGYGPTD